MEIALRIAGIGAGDEVITTPISWVAANVIIETGATGVRRPGHTISTWPRSSRHHPRTKAIIPVSCRACRSTWTASIAG